MDRMMFFYASFYLELLLAMKEMERQLVEASPFMARLFRKEENTQENN